MSCYRFQISRMQIVASSLKESVMRLDRGNPCNQPRKAFGNPKIQNVDGSGWVKDQSDDFHFTICYTHIQVTAPSTISQLFGMEIRSLSSPFQALDAPKGFKITYQRFILVNLYQFSQGFGMLFQFQTVLGTKSFSETEA